MSYGNDDDRRDYYREQDRKADYIREENRRYDNFVDDMKYERERNDRNRDEGMSAIREGNIAWGAHKLGMTDFAIDYLQSQTSGNAEPQPGNDARVTALNQMAELGAAEQPDVLQILQDRSMSAHDRVFLAGMTVIARLDAAILEGLQRDIDNTSSALERASLAGLRDKRNELQATIMQLMGEQNEKIRRILNPGGFK
jgi:hypothetical protein